VDEPFTQHILRKGTGDKDREMVRIHTLPAENPEKPESNIFLHSNSMFPFSYSKC